MAKIPNPPTDIEPGKTAKWDGKEWQIVDVVANVLPMPVDIPEGYEAVWDGSQWEIVEVPPAPEPPPPPTPVEVSEITLSKGLGALQKIAYLTTAEIERHLSSTSKAAVVAYVDAVAEIVRLAQLAIKAGEKFESDIPPMPTVDPLRVSGENQSLIEFVKPE